MGCSAVLVAVHVLLEHAEVYGNLYGTPRKAVEDALAQGRHVILQIDTQGAENIRRQGLNAKYIFIQPPTLEALGERLDKRGTPPDEKERRLKEAAAEMAEASKFDATVVNDIIERAVDELESILQRFGILQPVLNESRMEVP